MNSVRKIMMVLISLVLVGLISLLCASLLGSLGRGVFAALLFIAPVLLLAHGWFWSSRATLNELILSATLFTLVAFLVYSYFSGSYGFSADSLLLLTLFALPPPLGSIVYKIVNRSSR